MNNDTVREFATGLEDADNFFELVRQRAGLHDAAAARRLTCDITLLLAQGLPDESARVLLSALPKDVEDFVFPKLEPGGETARVGSLSRLEREVERRWDVDLGTAARYVDAVTTSAADRMSPIELTAIVKDLPLDLQRLFPARASAAA